MATLRATLRIRANGREPCADATLEFCCSGGKAGGYALPLLAQRTGSQANNTGSQRTDLNDRWGRPQRNAANFTI